MLTRIAESEVLPIHVYALANQKQGVVGGHVYRGCAYPNIRGLYYYGDIATG